MEDKKVWSKNEVFKFIARYKHYRELWDTKSIEYRNTLKRRNAHSKLAAEFNTTIAEIGRKIRILRSQFFYEYKKMYNDDDEDGSSSQSAYVTRWKYYEPLQFILIAREDVADSSDFTDYNKDIFEDSSPQVIKDSNNSDSEDDNEPKILIVSQKRKRSNSDSSNEQSEQSFQIHNDEFQIFGNYVANELRAMHYEKNIKELKRLIQQHIIRLTEEDDREYYSN
ncbi:uncharacterized protein LOC126775484 [Nymphalis io]|uniref:uncharacterized protein LOC126775484 n=1 Tax=Inachis io TaxID=171585 RepID=UPI002167DFE9|nr:uncharacterized protein LOC126775484 [Nymphalis io]